MQIWIILLIFALSSGSVAFAQEIGERDGSSKPVKEVGPDSTDATSAKLIALHNRARGGVEQIKATQTLKIKGTMEEGKNRYNMEWYRKTPNKYRVVRHYRKLGRDYTLVRAFDGETAWSQEVSPKVELPKVMGKAEAADFKREADFYGPLVDWKEKGHNFVYDREAKVNKRPSYLVKAGLGDGAIVYYYFDAKNFLIYRYGFIERFAASLTYAEYFVTKFSKVNGVWMEKGRDYKAPGSGIYKRLIFETISPDEKMPDKLFTLPKMQEYWLRSSRS